MKNTVGLAVARLAIENKDKADEVLSGLLTDEVEIEVEKMFNEHFVGKNKLQSLAILALILDQLSSQEAVEDGISQGYFCIGDLIAPLSDAASMVEALAGLTTALIVGVSMAEEAVKKEENHGTKI